MIPYARNVDKMVDAYSGNPQALMDKYAKDPQIAYLIALGEVKKRRQDLERQQAMQQPQQMPTVMQSLEQEAGLPPSGQPAGGISALAAAPMGQPAGGVDQRQVAQNVGGVLNFQQQKQQEALKKLAASGIAGAPGSQNVMPPKAMAAGGIVAFQEGGIADITDIPPIEALGQDVDELRRQLAEARRKLLTYGTRQQKADPEGYAQAKRAVEDLSTKERERASRYGEQVVGGILRPIPSIPRRFAPPKPMQPAGTPITAAPAGYLGEPDVSELATMAPARTPPPPPPPPPAPAPAPAPAAAPAQTGIAGLSQAMQGLGEDTAAAARRMMAQDPQAMARERERYVEDRMRLTPEQRGTYEQYQKDLEKFYADRARQQKEDELTSALIGAAGKSTLGLTGAGFSAGAMGARQRAAGEQLRGIEALGKARTGLVDIERANVKDALGAGAKEREQAGLEGRQGLESGQRLYSTEVQAETARLSEQSRSLDRALARKDLDIRTAETQLKSLVSSRDKIALDAAEAFDKANQTVAMQIGFLRNKTNKTPEDVARINAYESRKSEAVRKATEETDQILQSIKAKLGLPSKGATTSASAVDTSGFTLKSVTSK